MRKFSIRCLPVLLTLLAFLLVLAPPAQAADLGVERQVYAYLTTDLGLNSAAACGILANIEAESNFTLTTYGDSGTSYGLCQWHNSRFEALQRYCTLQGCDYSTLDGQLRYLAYELRTTYQSTYAILLHVPNTSDGAYQAAYYWCVQFEAPANREEAGARRGRNAQMKYWLRYGDAQGSDLNSYVSTLSPLQSGSSFYWENTGTDEEPASTMPISTPSAAQTLPEQAIPQETVPSAAADTRDAASTTDRPVLRFRYVPHHAPVSAQPVTAAAQPAAAASTQTVPPLACLFLCAGEPGKRCRLPEPEEAESTE